MPTPEDILDAFQHIPAPNILGITADTIEDDLRSTWDNLVAGFTRVFHPGRSTADLANAASVIANQADTASQLAEWNNAVIGIRNNKSIMQGIDETEEAVFSIDRLFSSAAPPASIAVTAASWPVSFWRATESAKKGFVSWLGTGITNVTGIYVDIYKLNSTSSQFDLIHSSTNKVGLIAAGSAWTYAVYNIPSVDRIQVNAGDVLGFSLRVTGTGTHSVAGASATWFPSHPTAVPAQPAAVITSGGSPSSIPFGSVTYAGDLAWFGSGIITGDTPPDYFAPRTTLIGDGATAGTITYSIPVWANFIDVVLLGGGGGGRGGDPGFGRSGDGGFAGSWTAETLVRGTDFPSGATTLTFFVGSGGSGGYYASGTSGSATSRSAITSGKAAIVAAGGAGGTSFGGARGRTPGNYTFNGMTYTGGGTAYTAGNGGNGSPGSAPGGGGGGGSGGTYGIAWAGADGARGSAWATARQN